jgi:hypothetical protein
VLELRQAHMRCGPRKLKRVLERDHSGRAWPAASTIGEMVKRAGLVVARKQRRKTAPYTEPLAHADGCNRVWCADFKGWFRSGDGERIDPLTISDAYSRYLLRCQAVEKTNTERVRAIFEAAFREYELPAAIRTDNGAPFASTAIAGLSRLAVWWMKLGIVPERIAARTSGAEWASRTHAPHLEARDGDACGCRSACATTVAGRFSARVQPGAPAPGTGHGNARQCVSTVAPPVSRAGAGAGVSQHHAGTQCEAPGGFSLEQARRVSQRSALGGKDRVAAGRPKNRISGPETTRHSVSSG